MRSTLVLSALAALLVTSVALAAKPQAASADLSSLAASGVTGTASFKEEQNGDVRLHEQVSGLTPGAEYTSVIFLGGATCGSGTAVPVMTFTANNAGKANFNVVVGPQAAPAITGSASITVQQGSTQLACGEIVAQ